MKTAHVASVFLAAYLISLTALAAPRESTAYIFWPHADAWVSDGLHLYGFPSVEARLFQLLDNGERVEIVFPEAVGSRLLDIFEAGEAEEPTVDVRLDGTLVATVNSAIGSHNGPYVDYFTETTMNCLKSLNDVDEAENFSNFLLDMDQGSLTTQELNNVSDKFKPTAQKLMQAFQEHRCTEVHNDIEFGSLYSNQIRAISEGVLLGEEDIVHFSQADLIVAVQVFAELYFGVQGFYAIKSNYLIKNALMIGMGSLSSFDGVYTGYSYDDFFDFIKYARSSESVFSKQDGIQLLNSCISGKAQLWEPFGLEQCYLNGNIIFDTITLGDTIRSFMGEN